jgi:hypothetical protein
VHQIGQNSKICFYPGPLLTTFLKKNVALQGTLQFFAFLFKTRLLLLENGVDSATKGIWSFVYAQTRSPTQSLRKFVRHFRIDGNSRRPGVANFKRWMDQLQSNVFLEESC